MDFENFEHFAILIGVIATIVGLLKGLSAWRDVRDESIAARTRQEDAIKEIAAEFRPRNGRTLAHTVSDIDASLKDHCAKAEVWFSDNDEAHKDIHRRIDGLFELFGAPTAARRIAERHSGAKEGSTDERHPS